MKKQINLIIDRVNTQYRTIELNEQCMLKKAEKCVKVLESAFEEMKELVGKSKFKDETEEIQFFKETLF